MGHMKALTDERAGADARAAYEWLLSANAKMPVAAVGFWHGRARGFLDGDDAADSLRRLFYGGGIAASANGPGLLDRAGALRAPMLFFWGGKDKHVTLEYSARRRGRAACSEEAARQCGFFRRGSRVLLRRAPELFAGGRRTGLALTQEFLRTYCR